MVNMKRGLNIFFYSIAGLAVLIIAVVILASKSLPEGREGVEAELLTDKMLAAINLPAWESLRYVKWSYRNEQHYVWDRWYNLAEIKYRDNRILLNLNTLEGRAWDGDENLEGAEKRELLQEAWEYWCNDSFWFNPIVKLRDEGVERKIVDLGEEGDGLLVTYTQGGITPGDSYLWILDDDGLPKAWRLWVSSLPVKGLKLSWGEWTDLDGAKISQSHRIGPVEIKLTNIASGDHHSELGLSADPFIDF
jgi:hypothetical protein